MDFPRVPITSDPALFRQLAALGRELVALHLLDADAAPALLKPITRYPVGGDSTVEKGHPRYDEAQRRVYISKDNVKTGKQGQYFEGVPPEVWDFQVGGYQPCQKWLKDRVGRQLTYDDLTHYQRIVVALERNHPADGGNRRGDPGVAGVLETDRFPKTCQVCAFFMETLR